MLRRKRVKRRAQAAPSRELARAERVPVEAAQGEEDVRVGEMPEGDGDIRLYPLD